ncbi:MAG: RNA polymerase sigma factor [Nannocystaceae bacterium]
MVGSRAMTLDPDLKTLNAWRSGDQKAAGELLNKFLPQIRRVVARKVPDEAIESVVDRVLDGLIKGHQSFRAQSKVRTYILTITKNSIADFHRHRARQPEIDVLESSVRDLGISPSGLLLEKENRRLLLEALRSIPLRDQILLELYLWEDMTAPELAEIFDCGVPTIRSRIRRAKERLSKEAREFLEDERELVDTLTDLDDWLRQVREELRPSYFAELRKNKET